MTNVYTHTHTLNKTNQKRVRVTRIFKRAGVTGGFVITSACPLLAGPAPNPMRLPKVHKHPGFGSRHHSWWELWLNMFTRQHANV